MIRVPAVATVVSVVVLTWGAPAGAAAPRLCVGPARGCFDTVQGAMDAAPAGATIRVDRGGYVGSVVISRSVTILGAGAGRTVLRGVNDSVVAVSTPDADNRPVVRLQGLTLTGGVGHGNGVVAVGGGLRIEPTDAGGPGGVVTLKDVEVRGNRAEPTTISDSPSGADCNGTPCPFASALGGGIFNGGDLTVVDSVVAGNSSTGHASDADGAGIFSDLGSLTIRSSRIVGNTSQPLDIGRFAEGGGVMIEGGGPLLVRDSVIANNAAVLRTGFGLGVNMNANSGGLHIGNNVSGATVLDTRVSDNRVVVDAPNGDAAGFDSAVLSFQAPLTVRRSEIVGNQLTADVATSESSGLSGSTVEFDGPGEITDTVIRDNSAYAHSVNGLAQASNGLTVFNFIDAPTPPGQVTARNLRILDNTARAVSEQGTAVTTGAGVINNSLLDLSDSLVRGNVATAAAPTATAQGGGIWNGVLLSGPPVTLRLTRDRVVGNVAATSAGGTAQGGGLYTSEPVDLVRTLIAGNRPDQCFGCSMAPGARALLRVTAPARSGGPGSR